MSTRRLILALTAVALGVLAALLVVRPGAKHEQVVPSFVTHTLGSTQSTSMQPAVARDQRAPRNDRQARLHRVRRSLEVAHADEHSRRLGSGGRISPTVSSRRTSVGYQTITVTPGSVEEFDTIVAAPRGRDLELAHRLLDPQAVLEG